MAATPLLEATDESGVIFNFEKIQREELAEMASLEARRPGDGKRRVPFALAFSGGGMRAAAFQCGVLWRLAELNLLKDVTYLSAVSGGGYIAMGFATHCIAEPPPQEGQVHEWYKRVVAKTVVRMQQNAGNFVRDFSRSGHGVATDGSGACSCLPRVLDVVVLIFTLMITILVHPAFFVLCVIMPIVVLTEAFFGEDMRRAFCTNVGTVRGMPKWLSIVVDNPTFTQLWEVAVGCFIVTFILFIMIRVLPFMKNPTKTAKKGERVHIPVAHLIAHGIYRFLFRITLFLVVHLCFIIVVVASQIYLFSAEHGSEKLHDRYCPGGANRQSCLESEHGCLPHVVSHFLLLVLAIFVASIVAMPYTGSAQATSVACITGPMLVLLFQVRLTQYRVFGPYTLQDFFAGNAYDQEDWDDREFLMHLATLIFLPFYPEIRGVLHYYYMKCLSGNFFANGKDVPMKAMRDCPLCPFIVVTGTSSDYEAPIGEDNDAISELSFSTLHVGSEETGYVKSPEDRTVGKCTALTAAGCVDACALTLSSLLTMRFWLEALNLSWGDYILFKDRDFWYSGDLPAWLDSTGETDRRTMMRIPADLMVWLVYLFVAVGHHTGMLSMYTTAVWLMALIVGFSFIPVGPIEGLLSMSPFLRQLQQATMFSYVGDKPPPMLYVTDGGCRDCTTLVQLCRRRQERILLVMAASDPHDELAVLKVAIEMAKNLEVATFYNPIDPRVDIHSMFTHFKLDRSVGYLELGITYPATRYHPQSFGHLYIVKNRLPPEFDGRSVLPHLTEAEVRGECGPGEAPQPEGMVPFDEEAWGKMTMDNLGPFCCCDISHTGSCGNCGPKFPHGSFTNFMYMTPMWCNSLARIAHSMSSEAVSRVTKAGPLKASWEQHIDMKARRLGAFNRHEML